MLQRRPTFTKPWSEAQGKTRTTFGGGSQFAATIKADPLLRELYAARGRRRQLNYRQMAIRDYFHAPSVDALLTAGYTAPAGGELVVRASDDFEVVRVILALHAADGNVVAEGDAILRDRFWHFTVPPSAGGNPPVNAAVTAFDRPGNSTTRQFPLSPN